MFYVTPGTFSTAGGNFFEVESIESNILPVLLNDEKIPPQLRRGILFF